MILCNDLKSVLLKCGNNSLNINTRSEVHLHIFEIFKLAIVNFGVLQKVSAPNYNKVLIDLSIDEVVFNLFVDCLHLLFEQVDFGVIMLDFWKTILLDLDFINFIENFTFLSLKILNQRRNHLFVEFKLLPVVINCTEALRANS